MQVRGHGIPSLLVREATKFDGAKCTGPSKAGRVCQRRVEARPASCRAHSVCSARVESALVGGIAESPIVIRAMPGTSASVLIKQKSRNYHWIKSSGSYWGGEGREERFWISQVLNSNQNGSGPRADRTGVVASAMCMVSTKHVLITKRVVSAKRLVSYSYVDWDRPLQLRLQLQKLAMIETVIISMWMASLGTISPGVELHAHVCTHAQQVMFVPLFSPCREGRVRL